MNGGNTMKTPTEREHLARSLITAGPEEAEDIMSKLVEIELKSVTSQDFDKCRDGTRELILQTLGTYKGIISPYLDIDPESFEMDALDDAMRTIEEEYNEFIGDIKLLLMKYRAYENKIARRETNKNKKEVIL